MLLLFFDTETTGLPNYRLAPDHESQPHIVQLAAQLVEEGSKDILGQISLIINNEGVEIPEAASNVHKITTEKAQKYGVPLSVAMAGFLHLYLSADLLVAHNVKFDKALLETAVCRYYGARRSKELSKPAFCTMEVATPIVALPPTEKMLAASYNRPKAPRLEECVKHFFGEELAGAHDAMVDVEACKRVYFHLKGLEATERVVAA